jgi:hypothetical protein
MNELTSIPTTLPQSRLGWAKRNTLTPGERLTVYTPDDRAPIDNNDVEQANRPATLGRTSYRWQRSSSSRSALGKAGGGHRGVGARDRRIERKNPVATKGLPGDEASWVVIASNEGFSDAMVWRLSCCRS